MRYIFLNHEYNAWKSRAARLCGIAALATFASAAWAAPEASGPAPEIAVKAVVASVEAPKPADAPLAQPQEATARAVVDFGAPADLGKLEQSRGGTDVHNDMKLDGMVSGNSAINVVTGANSIDTGAFANMSGIPVVIQNSGANVLIQNATIVNLQFK
jgi:hypothetical protein